jgi:ribosomal protein S18 acetylase RimI-like enzyme
VTDGACWRHAHARHRARLRRAARTGRALELGRRALWLQVNKRNTGPIKFYRAAGFEIVREAVFEIGGGFVMDDSVMAKPLNASSASASPDSA